MKLDGLIECTRDFKNDHRQALVGEFEELEMNVRAQQSQQPALELLIAFLGQCRFETGAADFMRAILDTSD